LIIAGVAPIEHPAMRSTLPQPALDRMRGARLTWLWATVPLLLAALVYAPILGNYFFGDDLLNLYSIVNKGLVEFLITPYGNHILMTRNAIYALCFQLFGTDTRWYFVSMLVTHLINVALLFRVIRHLTRSPRLACLGATLWGTCPLSEGALGWYAVYGHVLVTTIFLWLFLQLILIGEGKPPGRSAPWVWALLLLAASTSFGVGIAVTLVFPLVARLILPPTPQRGRLVAVAIGVALVVVGLYFGLHRLAADLYDAGRTGPSQVALLFANLGRYARVALLFLNLVGFGVSNLLLGSLAAWAPYGSALSIAALALYGAALVAVLARGTAALRRYLVATLLVGVACYAVIAAGRVVYFNNLSALLLQATRYHYLASLPFAVGLCLVLSQLQAWRPLGRSTANAIVAAWIAATAIGFFAAGRRIDNHDTERRLASEAVARIQSQIDAAAPGQDVFIENRPFTGVGPFLIKNPKVYPGLAALFVVFFPDNTVDGRRIFFVVPDDSVRAAAARGRRTGSLMVAAAAPAAGR
jgi:hypothetical protein